MKTPSTSVKIWQASALSAPASAASIAGFFKCCEATDAAYSFKKIPERGRIVCTVTGHGLKDPDVLQEKIDNFKSVEAKIDNVRRALGF